MGTVLDSLRAVSRVVCAGELPATEMAKRLGTIEKDYGGGLQVVVRPADPRLRSAEVTRRAGSETAASVHLELVEPATVAALRAAFGEYEEGPLLHYDSPIEIGFSEGGCMLIARVTPGPNGVAEGTIARLTIRPR